MPQAAVANAEPFKWKRMISREQIVTHGVIREVSRPFTRDEALKIAESLHSDKAAGMKKELMRTLEDLGAADISPAMNGQLIPNQSIIVAPPTYTFSLEGQPFTLDTYASVNPEGKLKILARSTHYDDQPKLSKRIGDEVTFALARLAEVHADQVLPDASFSEGQRLLVHAAYTHDNAITDLSRILQRTHGADEAISEILRMGNQSALKRLFTHAAGSDVFSLTDRELQTAWKGHNSEGRLSASTVIPVASGQSEGVAVVRLHKDGSMAEAWALCIDDTLDYDEEHPIQRSAKEIAGKLEVVLGHDL